MDELIQKIKKTNKTTIIIILGLFLLIIINLMSGAKTKKENIKTFEVTNTQKEDIYTIVNTLRKKLLKLELELKKNETLYSSNKNKNNLINQKLVELMNEHGSVINKKVLDDGSIVITTADGKKFIVHPDGTTEEIKDYKINPDGTVLIKPLKGEPYIYKKQKENVVSKNETKKKKQFKLSQINSSDIKKIVDQNGNVYYKDKDGNWYKITADGKKIKVGKNLSIDKDGNIIIDGKKLGKVYSLEKKSGVLLDKDGNIITKIGEVSENNQKLANSEKRLNRLKKEHGGIFDKKILDDGSILVTTADGKKFIIHPDGTTEKISDYKVNPDGSVEITKKSGKNIIKKLNAASLALKKNVLGEIKEKKMLDDGSILVTTADGKKFIIHPDGTTEEIQDYKINSDGTVEITKKNGEKLKKNIDKLEDVVNKIALKHGKIKNKEKLADGSMLVTTADGKKFLVHPDGTTEEVRDYSIDDNGNVKIIGKKGEVLKKKLSKAAFSLLSKLEKEHGKAKEQKILDDGSILVTTADGKKFIIHPDGTTEEVQDYKINSDGTVEITKKNGEKVLKQLAKIEDKLNKLENEHGKIKDKKILDDGSVIVTTADGKKFLVHSDGTTEEISDYKVNDDGTITIEKKGVTKENFLINYDDIFNSIINKNGGISFVIIDNNKNIVLKTIFDIYKGYVSNIGEVFELSKLENINTDKYLISFKKSKKEDIINNTNQGKKLDTLINNEKYITDFHLLKNYDILITLNNNNKYLIKSDGLIMDIKEYVINPDGTVVYTTKNLIKKRIKKELNNLINNSLKKHLLSDGSILVTTADGKKFLVHPDGKIEEISDYKIKPDGSVEIIGKDGKKIDLNKKYLNKIFTDKYGNKYIIDKNGKKHYVQNAYYDENGNLIYYDQDGKKHILTPTGKNYIVKEDKNGNKEILGYGNIVDVNNKKVLILDKVFEENLGYELSYFINNKKKEYEEINSKLLENNDNIGKDTKILLKNNIITLSYIDNDDNKINKKFLNFISYKIKTKIYKIKDKNKYIFIQGKKILLINKNKIKTFNNINYYLKDYKISIKNSSENINYKLEKNKYIPIFETKETLFFNLFDDFYISTKKEFPLFYKINKEFFNSINIRNQKFILNNSKFFKIINNNFENDEGKISKDEICLKYGNFYIKKGVFIRNYCNKKSFDNITFFQGGMFKLGKHKDNIIQLNKKSYFIFPLTKIIKQNNIFLIKPLFKEIKLKRITNIIKGILLKDKGLVFKYGNINYYINYNEYKILGRGKLIVSKDGKVLLKNNGRIKVIGNVYKNKNEIIENGNVKVPKLTKKEIEEINKLNNGEINDKFSFFVYGQKIFLENGKVVFYNKKSEVIVIDYDGKVMNLGKGKIYLNKQTKKVFFVNFDKYIYIGKFKYYKILDNIIYQTTNGMFFIKNEKIYQITNQNKLIDMNMKAKIDSLYLYGKIIRTDKEINLGKIIGIFEGNIDLNNNIVIKEQIDMNNYQEKNINKNNGQSMQINKKLFVENGETFLIKNGKKIKLGKFYSKGQRYLVFKDKNGKQHIIDLKDNKELTFIKTKDGKIKIKKDDKIIEIPSGNNELKIKKNSVYFKNTLLDSLDFKDELNNKTSSKIRLLNENEFEQLFNNDLEQRKKIIEKKEEIKPKIINNFRNKTNYNYENPKKYKVVILESKVAENKNMKLFFSNNSNNKQNIIKIDSDSGNQIVGNRINNKSFYIMPGTKVKVVLSGGSLSPILTGVKANGALSIATYFRKYLKSFFIIKSNILLKDGTVVPTNNGIIVATPVPTTSQRMFYKIDGIYIYDYEDEKWYYSQTNGIIISSVDNVPGLPGIIIDTRNKYIAKATIYSILQGISKYLLSSSSALAAAQNMTDDTSSVSSPIGSQLGSTVLGGAGEQINNISKLFLSIINSQLPFLAVENGEKGYFIPNSVVVFKPLKIQ